MPTGGRGLASGHECLQIRPPSNHALDVLDARRAIIHRFAPQ